MADLLEIRDGFVAKCIAKFGNNIDYSLVKPVLSSVKVEFVCNECGLHFFKKRSNHIRYGTCPVCSKKERAYNQRNSSEKILSAFKETHGDRYDYSEFVYVNLKTKGKIHCSLHGVFMQSAQNHRRGAGCPICGRMKCDLNRRSNTEEFILKARLLHGNLFGYDEVKYETNRAEVKIYCKKCQSYFMQKPEKHLSGHGCQKCSLGANSSKPETEISDYIWGLGIANETNVKGILRNERLELDIWVPSHSLAIEFNGLRWHSEQFNMTKFNIRNKTRLANEKGIDLIHVREDQWKEKKAIVKSIIANRLGINENKTWARKCVKRDLTKEEFKKFAEENHLQGYAYADTRIGLFFKGELVAAIGVLKGDLNRYVIKLGWKVGAALKRLIKGAGITHTFCDLTTFNGSGYVKTGFVEDSRLPASFVWVKDHQVRHRRFGQKRAQEKRYGFLDWNKTEAESMAENGWYRLWDCGKIKFTI